MLLGRESDYLGPRFGRLLFRKKKGDLGMTEIIILIIVVVFLVLMVAALILFKGKIFGEEGILAAIKNMLRFGR